MKPKDIHCKNANSTVSYSTKVLISKFAEKQLRKLPSFIQDKLESWMQIVETLGIRAARQIKGYHDEPLQGSREGQRSIRLNRAYRAIYVESAERVELQVIEVNKHDY